MNIEALTPISAMDRGDPEDDYSLGQFADRAEQFLLSKRWCKSIRNGYFGLGNEGILGVFLFEISPGHPDVDDWLWVVTGDLPPAYLVCDLSPDPPSALRSYIREMRRWVEAVHEGRSIDDEIIPVNAPATREYADMLESRLDLLEELVLSQYDEAERPEG